MNKERKISEFDVLKATIPFLANRGVVPFQFSISKGQGINYGKDISKILEIFKKFSSKPQFSNEGPDVVGSSFDANDEFWKIECKGLGKGGASTLRNNFDRGLASVVSYNEDENELKRKFNSQNLQLYLGFALPDHPEYLKNLKKRIRKPLRQRLNLWILLYSIDKEIIIPIAPNEDYNVNIS